jgi:hypothetical protein
LFYFKAANAARRLRKICERTRANIYTEATKLYYSRQSKQDKVEKLGVDDLDLTVTIEQWSPILNIARGCVIASRIVAWTLWANGRICLISRLVAFRYKNVLNKYCRSHKFLSIQSDYRTVSPYQTLLVDDENGDA